MTIRSTCRTHSIAGGSNIVWKRGQEQCCAIPSSIDDLDDGTSVANWAAIGFRGSGLRGEAFLG